MKRLQRLEVKPETAKSSHRLYSAQRQGCVPGACVLRFCSLGSSLAPGVQRGEPFCRQQGELDGARRAEQSRYPGRDVAANVAEGTVRQGARTHEAAGVDRHTGRCVALLSPCPGGSACAAWGLGVCMAGDGSLRDRSKETLVSRVFSRFCSQS